MKVKIIRLYILFIQIKILYTDNIYVIVAKTYKNYHTYSSFPFLEREENGSRQM